MAAMRWTLVMVILAGAGACLALPREQELYSEAEGLFGYMQTIRRYTDGLWPRTLAWEQARKSQLEQKALP